MAHVSIKQLAAIRAANPNRRLVLVTGQFNVIHAGHIRLLKFARSLGDELVVALLPDAMGAYVPQALRLAAMKSLHMIDRVFIVKDNIQACVEALRPDTMVKGAEHEKRGNPESAWLRPWGGRLVFCTDDPRFNLDDVIQGMLRDQGAPSGLNLPRDYLDRHEIGLDSLPPLLDAMGGLRVCVIGDLIIDEYVLCNPLGMSREDPTLVVSPVEETRFVGGAGIVAGHVAGLGGKTSFITVAGADATAAGAGKWLESRGVKSCMLVDPDRPTTVKRRYRAQNKTLLRVNRMSQQQISRELQDQVMDILSGALPETDLLIFSDFSYGLLPPDLVDRVTAACLRHDVRVTADSQTSSQTGDLTKFKDALLVTPTEIEARHAMRDFNQGLVALVEELRSAIRAQNVVVTLGGDGCLVYSDPDRHRVFTDQLPPLNPHPVDVAGAGDSFLAAASMALAAGGDIWRAALLGSVAAGVQVGRIGNTPLSAEELRRRII